MTACSPTASEIIEWLTRPTQRDKQRRIGPSEVGDMCEKCLGEKLMGKHKERTIHTWPPIIGTSVHSYLEHLMSGKLGFLTETPVVVGAIEGYGEVRGTMDFFDQARNHALDYKVVGKKKIAAYKRALRVEDDGTVTFNNSASEAATLKKYWIQLSLYSAGMERLGHTVETMSLLFIPRDEPIEAVETSVHEVVFPYDAEVALKALQRAGEILSFARNCGTEELESDPDCYYCRFERWKN